MKQNSKYTILFAKLVLVFILVAAFTVTWYIFYSQAIPFPFFRRGNWLIVFLYAFLYYVLGKQMGAFHVGMNSKSDIIYAQILTLIILNVFTYFEISLIGRYWLDANGMLIMTAVQIATIVIWSVCVLRLHSKLHPPQNMVFLYDVNLDKSFAEKIAKHNKKFIIKDCVDINMPEDELLVVLKNYDAAILCGADTAKQNEILKICYRLGKRLHVLPTVSDIIMNGAEQTYMFDTPLFLCRNTGFSASQLITKRITDVLLALVGCVVAVPFLIVIAIMIKIDDGGPVFYTQTRCTIGGKQFKLYKFRTMCVDAEADGVARMSSKTDDRVTRVGRKIRKMRLDEIPQFINILKGDISIIGPRPERPELIEEYRKTIPEFDFRLKVKAGLTGYAQVLGKYSTKPQDKLLLDLAYIENYSFWLDIKIALITLKILFTPSSTD